MSKWVGSVFISFVVLSSIPVFASESEDLTNAPSPVNIYSCGHRQSEREEYLSRFESRDLHEEKAVNISITRKWQHRISYNCQGQVYQDGIVTVESPTEDFKLKPTHQGLWTYWLGGVEIFNEQTCNYAAVKLPQFDVPLVGLLTPLTGNKFGEIKIKGDIAPAALTFQLEKGRNKIYYTYYEKCIKTDSESDCKFGGKSFSGIYYVNVDYNEVTLPGTKIYHDSCDDGGQK
jgi:hypothetical protein